MKWIYSGDSGTRKSYSLWDNNTKLLKLDFNEVLRSVRIDCGDEKRVFLIAPEGFRKHKTVLRNEYGMKLGKLVYESRDSVNGTIEFENERYHYTIINRSNAELIIYKNSIEVPLVSCDIANSGEHFPVRDAHPLLLALSWYLFSFRLEGMIGENSARKHEQPA